MWYKSVRAVMAVLFTIGVHVALLKGMLDGEAYKNLAMVVITAYFVKRTNDIK